MDPLSIAASISGLLTTATSLSKYIIGIVDSIRDAPKHIKAINSDTKAMFIVLGTLSGYLSEEDTAAGILHDMIAADLKEVLANSISVLKELQLIINECTEGGHGDTTIGKWKSCRWHFKEAQIKLWGEQLTAHKVTLSVTVSMANMINTNTTAQSTRRIEDRLIELKSMVTELLLRVNTAEDRHTDLGVIIDNYSSTMQQIAHGADSILSVGPWERPRSPSLVVSSAGVTHLNESLPHACAPSTKTADSL